MHHRPLWKRWIDRASARLGLHISRVSPTTSDEASLGAMLEQHGVDLILDVGANVGQFAQMVRRIGYTGRILSFEPMEAPYAVLQERSAGDPAWFIAERGCLGASEKEVEIHVSENSIASSLLPATDMLIDNSPSAAYVGVEKATIRRLDDAAGAFVDESERPFLKIDVQGLEDAVLDGSPRTLPKLVGLHVELSLVPLYEEAQLFTSMVRRLEQEGFELHRLAPAFVDGRDGRWLAADGVFFRKDR